MNNYTQDFRTLGVEPGCSLQSLKSARRRLVKSWHPDRFFGSDKEQAEQRIKEINTAFDRLIEYHRTHGVLPGGNSEDTAASTAAGSRQTPPSATASKPRERLVPDVAQRIANASRSAFHHWTLVVTGIVVTIVIIRLVPDSDPSQDEIGRAQEPVVRPGAPTYADTAPTEPPRYFTIGSSIGEVYATQGVPTATEADAWHYGKSTVYFSKGVVTGWNHDPANPLHATPVPLAAKQDVAKFFTFGSTKAEVRAVQGSPLLETDTLWDFGLSKVQFRDDRVIAWESSPLQPLRARK